MAHHLNRPVLKVLGAAGISTLIGIQSIYADDGKPERPVTQTVPAPDIHTPRHTTVEKEVSQVEKHLQIGIEKSRTFAEQQIGSINEQLQKAIDQWIKVEEKIENTAKEVAPRNEKLMPGLIYVSLAGMLGTIVTRRRLFPLRFITPLITASAASAYFLPETSENVKNLLYKYERHYAPSLAKQQEDVTANAKKAYNDADAKVGENVKKLEKSIASGIDQIQEWTGIPLNKK